MSRHCYLATYRPLIRSRFGREASERHGLLPFIDGSCRREPDFESPFPSITATCRGANFAPRLKADDLVLYMTVRGRYLGDHEPGWRLVAVLRMIERFESHMAAAEWYRARGCALPSNCIVPENPPKPFHLTNGNPPKEVKLRVVCERNPEAAVRLWDATYRKRITDSPMFLACKAEFLELRSPPQVHKSDLLDIFGRVPSTLNPPRILCNQLDRLLTSVRSRCV